MKTINFENIVEDFNLLENWEDKYRYIIDIGKDLKNILKNFEMKITELLVVQVKFGLSKIVEKNGKKSFHLRRS